MMWIVDDKKVISYSETANSTTGKAAVTWTRNPQQ